MSDQHRAGAEAERLDKRTAERLLDGADGHARLHVLLSAAAAPARPEELAGEDAAVAAFRTAPRPARTSRAAILRRFLTVKVLAVVGGSLILTGGAAYATMNGHLPGQDSTPSPSPTLHERPGPGEDSIPAGEFSPKPPTSPTSTAPPTTSPSSSPSKKHGKPNAPGQQNKATPPRNTRTPPRGPGNDNGKPPTSIPRNNGGQGRDTRGGPGDTNHGAPPITDSSIDHGTGPGAGPGAGPRRPG